MEKKFILNGNDNLDEVITNASRVVADEAFKQNGMDSIAEDREDEWYELQESLRVSMFKAIADTIDSFNN